MRSEEQKELARLKSLTEARFGAAQADMAAVLRRERAIRDQLRDLAARRAQSAARPEGQTDPALTAGADVRWHRWIDQRRARLNQELAGVLAQKAMLKGRLQKAFGRDEALRMVGLRLLDAARQKQSRQTY